MKKRAELLSLVKGKKVFIAAHWDADGVASAALIYHLIKPHAKDINTTSKGLVFQVFEEDIKGDYDLVICVDIHPSQELDPQKVIYIDHHPSENNNFLLTIHDDTSQSCSLLVWQELLHDTNNPYFIFLTLVGYFGDNGNRESIPPELQVKAQKLLKTKTRNGIHDLMEKKNSYYSKGYYYEIEKYVSYLNTGKRMHWSGNIPLELFKNIDSYQPFIYLFHPIAAQLHEYKLELRNHYNMPVKIHNLKHLQYGIIECDKNVQGVLAARHMKDKPIMIMNRFNGKIIGSFRVPDDCDFDAGAYLSEFNNKINSLVGGGHEKAGGVTFDEHELEDFIELIKKG